MNIHGVPRVGGVHPYTRQEPKMTDVEGKGKKEKQRDEVQISSEAQELLGAQGTMEAEQRSSKIAELKKQVAAGTYHVDARHIAEKLYPHLKERP